MGLEPLETYTHDVVVRDGRTVHLRPIRSSDLDAMMDMWSRLSPESIRMRFFAPRKMTREQMRYFVDLDWSRRFAIVAEQSDQIIGVSRFDVLDDDPTSAEFAVLVEDAHQGRGVGTALLRALMEPAADMGVTGFVADVLRENRRMLSVMRDAGLEPVVSDDGQVVHATFPTTPTEHYLAASDAQDSAAAVAALSSIFSPASIAVVGASRDPRTIGGLVFGHLIRGGFAGPVYPVNTTSTYVQSVAAYPSLADCPTVPELIVVCVPAPAVVDVVAEAGRLGTRAAVVISAGFAEVGQEGERRERELMEVIRGSGMRLVGPNCMGVLNAAADVRMNATFSPVFPAPGRVGFSSQSGALGLAVLAAAERLGIGLSSFASIGNKPDISGNDLLQYWEADPATDVILLYLESFGNPRKFGRLARRIGRTKPIAAVKSGRSMAGTRAAGSDPAPLAAGDVAVDALFHQAGVVRVDTLEELFDVASVLSNQPLPAGSGVAILTNGGGPGTLAADACVAQGLRVPDLSRGTHQRLARLLPAEAGTSNPVDMVAGASAEAYGQAMRILADDSAVDALLVVFVPPVVTRADDVAREISRAARRLSQATATRAAIPVVSVFMSEQVPTQILHEARIPAFGFPESAARALGRVARYAEWRRQPLGNVVQVDDVDEKAARQVLEEALADVPLETSTMLTARQADRLLAAYGIPTAPFRVVEDGDEAVEAFRELGGSVAVKLAAAVHKTELGGVALGLDDEDSVRSAVERMQASLRAARHPAAQQGFLVQEMIGDGVEMAVGVVTDPSFGPIVAVGLGGTLVELLADASVRIHPLTDTDVTDMLRGLRGYQLLHGYRGSEPVDVDALSTLLFRLSTMVEHLPEIDEIDLNPVFVRRRGVSCADVRICVVRRRGIGV